MTTVIVSSHLVKATLLSPREKALYNNFSRSIAVFAVETSCIEVFENSEASLNATRFLCRSSQTFKSC